MAAAVADEAAFVADVLASDALVVAVDADDEADVADWAGMEKRIKNLEDAVADLKADKVEASAELSEEVEALGEAAKLMTLMNICQDDEEYEKCAIIKNRMNEVNKILKKYK